MESARIERHESMLGAWTRASWTPPAGTLLHGHIRRMWYFDGVLLARRQRIFPDGSIEIVVQLDEPHRPGNEPQAQGFPPVCITGLRLTSEVVVAPPGRCRVLGIILSPPCAHLLADQSLAALTGITVDFEELAGRTAVELAERARAAAGPAEALAAAQAWLSARIQGARAAKGNFREQFGTTPKRYQRIMRFCAAVGALARSRGSLIDIAGTHGYYDQAHFTNEFREHAGVTPSAYLRSNPFPGGMSVADE